MQQQTFTVNWAAITLCGRARHADSRDHSLLAQWLSRAIATAIALFAVNVLALHAQTRLPPIDATRAFAVFEAFCANSVPSFRKSERTERANAISTKTKTGTVNSTKENSSFRLANGLSSRKTCSPGITSDGSKFRFQNTIREILTEEKIATTENGSGGLYQDTTLVLIGDPTDSNGETHYSLKTLWQR